MISMRTDTNLSVDYLRTRLDYDPLTGIFMWLPVTNVSQTWKTWNTRFAGKQAGTLLQGYLKINVDGEIHLAHRLAWLIMTGQLPKSEIDHIDTDRSNNKWDNLRLASSSQQRWNSQLSRRNTSGHKGVAWLSREKRWRTRVMAHGKEYCAGYFCYEDAVKAHDKLAQELHGEFVRNSKDVSCG